MPLPPGLLLNPQTGELTGVPTESGTYVINLKVRDTFGNQREVSDTVVINAYTPMTWTGVFAPNLMRTRAISGTTLTLNGGLAPHTYTINSGALPAGLTLNSTTGAITGTPSATGAFNFVIRVTDALGQIKDTAVISGTVAENLTLSYPSPKAGTTSVLLSVDDTTAGGTAPYLYEITSGTLPTGITILTATGTISGIPNQTNSGTVTVRVTDSKGFTATANLTFDIVAYPTVSGNFVRSMVGKAGYSRTFSGSGGHTPYTWTAFSLPPGLSINSSTGEVTGTPTTAGTYASFVRLTDNLGVTKDSAVGSVEIASALTLGGTYNANPTRNILYPTFIPVATGGYAPRTYDISAGSLPAGLTLNSSNGAISGTPTTQASYTATLRVTDADGSTATMAVNIDVQGDTILTGGVPNTATTTVAFSGDNLGRTGGQSPYTWSVVSGALPTGLSLNTSTGDITGTPTAAGTFNFNIRVTDANGDWDETGNDSIVVAAYPTLSGSLPDDTNGTAYNASLSRAGGHAPYTYDISAGTLPTGTSINSSTGAITGTLSATGTFNFTVRVTDNAGNVATKADSVTIYAPVVVSGTYADSAEAPFSNGTDGLSYFSDTVTASGGKAPLTWTLAGGSLPPGLTLNAATGVISGVPSYVSVASGVGYNDYLFTVRATDEVGSFDDSEQTIRLYWHIQKSPGSYNAATRGVAYSDTVSAFYGKSPYTHAVVSGTLPAGLSINASTGAITGTPSTHGSFGLGFRFTDALFQSVDWSQTFVIYPVVAITGAATNGTQQVSYSYTYGKSGGSGVYSFSIVSGALPAGLSLNSSTGTISGTPTGTGTSNFTVRVTSAGSTDDLADSIQINAKPNISVAYPHGTVGQSYSGTVSTTGGWTPYSYALHSGSKPPGTTLNSTTGALTGTPSVAGTYTPTIRVTDALGNISIEAETINIASALNIPGAFASPGQQGVAYSSQVSATGGWAPYSFSHVGGSLPTGLSLAANGTLSGTPSATGTFNFTVRVTDNDGHTFNRAMTVVINAPAFNVTISPSPATASAFSGGFPVTVSKAVGTTVTGAVGTVSYSWTKIASTGGAPFTVTSTSGSGLTAQFTTRFDYEETETWRVTVTTSTGQSDTAQVDITLIVNSGA